MFLVRDHGGGVSNAALERLLAPSTGRRLGGRGFARFGLALWIAQNLVQSMGGRVFVATEPGAGTAVGFVVPTAPPAAERRRAAPST